MFHAHWDGCRDGEDGLPVMSTQDALAVSQASGDAHAQYLLTLRKAWKKALAGKAPLLGLPADTQKEPGG